MIVRKDCPICGMDATNCDFSINGKKLRTKIYFHKRCYEKEQAEIRRQIEKKEEQDEC